MGIVQNFLLKIHAQHTLRQFGHTSAKGQHDKDGDKPPPPRFCEANIIKSSFVTIGALPDLYFN